MIDQQVSLRNRQALIHNLEAQVGQLTTLVNEKFSLQFPEKKKTRSHVMLIDIEEEAISEFLEALEVEPQQPDPKPKKPKLEIEEFAGIPSSRRKPAMLMSWARSEPKNFVSFSAYKPPLSFLSWANLSPLEREHLEFIKHVKGIPINTPFFELLSNIPEYEFFLQDLLDTRQQLKKNSKWAKLKGCGGRDT